MGTRLELHAELLKIAENVYYQAPSDLKMKYPCIRYNVSAVKTEHADNRIYRKLKSWHVTYIALRPNDTIIDTMLEAFPTCRFDRHYEGDNLHHYSFVLFY
jgi:hypothetical protein